MNPQDELALVRKLNSEGLSASEELKIIRALNSGDVNGVLEGSKSSLGMKRATSFDELFFLHVSGSI